MPTADVYLVKIGVQNTLHMQRYLENHFPVLGRREDPCCWKIHGLLPSLSYRRNRWKNTAFFQNKSIFARQVSVCFGLQKRTSYLHTSCPFGRSVMTFQFSLKKYDKSP